MWAPILIAALSAYLLGNLNGSVCISRLLANDDVRSHGSGNAGMTNFFRNYGGWGTLLVMLVDLGKAVLACFGAGFMLLHWDCYREGLILGAIFVTLGHDFPALLGFRGGKGILCGLAIALVIDWRIALLIFAVFVLTFALTKYVSLGSVLASAAFGVGFAIFQNDNIYVMAGGIALSVLAVFMHRANIKRLLSGTESKIHLFHKDKKK